MPVAASIANFLRGQKQRCRKGTHGFASAGKTPAGLNIDIDAEGRTVGAWDKGEGKGALVMSERKVTDKASGELIATLSQTTFCRGDGGFGGAPREAPAPRKPHGGPGDRQ